MTPEGKIKKQVKDVLKKRDVHYFMPVQTGFGNKHLDFICCVAGRYLAIETKAPGKDLTSLQRACELEIERSGGMVFVIKDQAGVNFLNDFLEGVHHDRTSKSETQDGRGPARPADTEPVPRRARNAVRQRQASSPAARPD